MRTTPSAEQVASCNPKCLGANLTSVTGVLLSTKLIFFTHWDWDFSPTDPSGPIF